jgi:hypothetical protein
MGEIMVKFVVGDIVVVSNKSDKYYGHKGKVVSIKFYSDVTDKHYDYGVKLSGKHTGWASGRLGFNKEELSKPATNKIQCSECALIFADRQTYLKHIRETHYANYFKK